MYVSVLNLYTSAMSGIWHRREHTNCITSTMTLKYVTMVWILTNFIVLFILYSPFFSVFMLFTA